MIFHSRLSTISPANWKTDAPTFALCCDISAFQFRAAGLQLQCVPGPSGISSQSAGYLEPSFVLHRQVSFSDFRLASNFLLSFLSWRGVEEVCCMGF